jgi:hypothetical protein
MKVRIVNERIAELNTVNSNVELPPEYLGTNLSQYLYDGQNWSIDPDYPVDTPDWTGLRADLLGSATIAAWFDTLPAINREDITAQIQGRDTATLADAVVRVDYDPVKLELNQFLTDRNIGVQLP